jgi:hypothetical protein
VVTEAEGRVFGASTLPVCDPSVLKSFGSNGRSWTGAGTPAGAIVLDVVSGLRSVLELVDRAELLTSAGRGGSSSGLSEIGFVTVLAAVAEGEICPGESLTSALVPRLVGRGGSSFAGATTVNAGSDGTTGAGETPVRSPGDGVLVSSDSL